MTQRCAQCGALFRQRTRRHVFCSIKCSRRASQARRKEQAAPFLRTIVCRICGKEVVTANRRLSVTCGDPLCKKANAARSSSRLRKDRRSKESPREPISEFRADQGLKPLEPASTECLRCGREFASWDTRRNRVCPTCRRRNNRNQPAWAGEISIGS